MRGQIVSITVSRQAFKIIEETRGDVPRSKFLSKLIDKTLFDERDPNQRNIEV